MMPICFKVEPDRYFFAGDHRLHSNDSRLWGTVHRDDILSKVSIIYWSWDFNGTWLELGDPATWRSRMCRSVSRPARCWL